MERYPRLNAMHSLLFGSLLLTAACGGEQSVASKSAAAYEEAKAKGIEVARGHEHGGHAATENAAETDHAAHGTTGAAPAAMDHSAHGAATTSVDHAAMGHSSAGSNAPMDHAAMGHGTITHSGTTEHSAMDHGTSGSATDHAAMGHGAAADSHSGQNAPDAHAQHGVAMPATQHAGMQHNAQSPAHAEHATPPVTNVATVPRSNTEIRGVQPSETLRADAFDAPAASSVSEAAKAAQAGGHEGHGTGSITPVPATRDAGSAIYTCPMHPEVTSDKPGNCPKCGMTLVKKN
jgi:hypothetical protein